MPLQTPPREEVLAGLGWASMFRSARGDITGVAHAEATKRDALFINRRDFSATTIYRDFALNTDLFHWESQNATPADSPTGRRYINHVREGSHVVLFVREAQTDDIGAAPFTCLGPATYVEHRGDRPMAITWRLHRPMPTDLFSVAAVVAS